ncbi:ESPR domain-containing protein [Avibacterium paragallinarum]|uniref:ESPR domain-containing protein n=1 Tax=Avibacterium paragallinarum TaxID=728 RepID=A0A0F5EXE6_AVIPA|nr:ESPR domain-containing protein [Avibacterium paragallinarum]KAA6209075.1 hypothetical protein F1968_05975 [Avibacterium paragallinarum]KKB01268.1 hypothetical protein Z012_07545 [Avibacterium paragallinarum]MEE3607977.1 ESPR domain-containing protein [Avibacterium paragallinarum]MEE3620501.1 ESPR domain-containing protein [Avibacterium paragallinarum]MEE3667973.1 ESPR domain-containing protein [Avibacterium paragallinarum]
MNKVYKIIFDPILGLFKVVSELAKGKGKTNSKSLKSKAVLLALAFVFPQELIANDGIATASSGSTEPTNNNGMIIRASRTSGGDTPRATVIDNAINAIAIGNEAKLGVDGTGHLKGNNATVVWGVTLERITPVIQYMVHILRRMARKC